MSGARIDRRWPAIALTLALISLGGAALRETGGAVPAEESAAAHVEAARRAELDRGFRQAVVMLHARRYDHALTALHRLLEIAPEVPEVHVNMGYALLGLERPRAARDFFQGAIALAPSQANAYYGLALALHDLGDIPAARGAMRTFAHLAAADDPYQPKARAALARWNP